MATLPGIAQIAQAWHASPLRRRYETLERRERVLLKAGSVLIGAAVLWLAAIQPTLDYREGGIGRLQREGASLAWMTANRPFAEARRDAGEGAPQAQLSTINRSAGEFDLPLRRIQPDGDGFVVHIESRPFASIIAWMETLETQHGIRIVNLSIDADKPGQVNARLTLR